MGKRAITKKGGASDTAKAGPEEDASISVATTLPTPRTLCQRKWSKRADEAVIEMGYVQELLQQHAAKVDALKREMEELTYTAAGLWAANPDELPLQYKDKQGQLSFRLNSPSLMSTRSNVTTPTKRRGAPDTSSTFPPAKSDTSITSPKPVPETVEQALQQLPPARRAKVSAELQALFYSPQVEPPFTDSTHVASTDAANRQPLTEEDHAAPQASDRSKKSPQTAEAPPAVSNSETGAQNDGQVPAVTTGSRNKIPQALLLAMKELQAKRISLEIQLTKAANATARQLQRFQLLQEEVMVSQYGLDAAQRDVQQEIQQQLRGQELQQNEPTEDHPVPM